MKWNTERHLTRRQRTILVTAIVIGFLLAILWALTDALIVGAQALTSMGGIA